jgi:hypothetical protein
MVRTHSNLVRLIFCLAAVCRLSHTARTQYGGGCGTADDPYQIATGDSFEIRAI